MMGMTISEKLQGCGHVLVTHSHAHTHPHTDELQPGHLLTSAFMGETSL